MKDFGSYILAVTAFSLIGGALCALLPQKDGKTGRYFSLVISLCVLVMLVTPVKGFLEKLTELNKELSAIDEKYSTYSVFGAGDTVVRLTEKNLEEEIKKILKTRFNINSYNAEIKIMLNKEDLENIKIEKIIVDLTYCRVAAGAKEAQVYFSNLFDCPCEVITK